MGNLKPQSKQSYHYLNDKNYEEGSANCSVCGPVLIRRNEGTKGPWRCENAIRIREWRKLFGIELDLNDPIFFQPKVCAICRTSGVRMCLDHDHETNQLRGWLCVRCNRVLGLMGDNPVLFYRASQYLAGVL